VTESLRPGTRSTERRVPPNIFVIGESSRVPEDLVIAAFCFGPTSNHPFAPSPETEPEWLTVGDEGMFGVPLTEPSVEPADCITCTHSS
jgi:hypothetical protein